MHEAKRKLSQLVERAEAGEEVIITKSEKPAVKLVPYKTAKKRSFGQFRGQVYAAKDFDLKEVNEDIANMFGL